MSSKYKVENIKKCYQSSLIEEEIDELRVKNAEKICDELLKRGVEELDKDQHKQFIFSLTEECKDCELNEVVHYIIEPNSY